jgi:hypothetical protein
VTEYRDKFTRVFDSLSRLELQDGAHGLEEIGLEDLFGRGDDKWLGFYTAEGIRTALDRYGLFADLAQMGFEVAEIEIRTDDPEEHTLRIFSRTPAIHDPLLELVVRRGTLEPTGELRSRVKSQYINLLQIEWLLLQNPSQVFGDRRPPLPGQEHPGLGIGKQVLEILRNTAKRLKLDGLVTVPSYFHNSFFYSEEFYYFDPSVQGLFLAACRDVLPQTQSNVGAASWAFLWNLVREHDNDESFPWFHAAQICPVSDLLVEYFDDSDFDREVANGLSKVEFVVDREALRERLFEAGIDPFDAARFQELISP